ncbi:sodium:solute symporter [Priestia megaterium]|uniref:Solute symporter family protein n=2 Tax=Priestia megaterium TaxID=1404 RepID=A0A0B6AI35_PRIM2|nr:sodium:solute symporter [Priestia megaterium]AJI24540.1 solute symporter family protein [Priestia megaterium NBRC 15308 = ATCC 14581]KFM96815.1 solute symporter family protein [Priestia megaterium]KGJ76039.1 sodium:solute symporter [Priestia megaterium NBRC 15308 = ATCC 14581]MDR4232127.1 sodium:solute symporter family protein [Priestia megaterium]MED3806237.1 sodium:solute symporter [Priestia megaterium]
MNSALIIILLFLVAAIFLGIRSTKGKDMNLEQWTVGGRGFGAVLVFVLMAGEIYTTFSFLGGSGWAYGKGAPALYVLIYISLSYVLSYWLLPVIWKYARDHKLVSQPDFFVSKYKSPYLGVLVAAVGVIAVIPVIVVQLKGLGIIVSQASYGAISMPAAIWMGAISLTLYVMISGIHGSAWTAVIKDIMMLAVIGFLGIYLPFHYYGGYGPMFEAVNTAKPGFLKFPEQGLSVSWFISTVILLVLGFYMWPQVFSSSYTAKNAKVFRKNAIISPLYTLMLLFVFFVGFAAILKVPGLSGGDVDLALLRISIQTFDPWFIGIIGGAGLLTALVPGSMLLMSASTLLAKNIYKPFAPQASEGRIARLAKSFVPVVALISVYFTLNGGTTLSTIILMGYSLMTQLFPSLLFSLKKNNFVTKQGAAWGIVAGIIVVAYITISGSTIGTLFPSLPQQMKDINVGFIALLVNFIVMWAVSMLTKQNEAGTKVC